MCRWACWHLTPLLLDANKQPTNRVKQGAIGLSSVSLLVVCSLHALVGGGTLVVGAGCQLPVGESEGKFQ
jgi:hypothetical protein